MSDNMPAGSSPESSWSPFETFEMPTTEVVFELPQAPVEEAAAPESVVAEEVVAEEVVAEEVVAEEVVAEEVVAEEVVAEEVVAEEVVAEEVVAEEVVAEEVVAEEVVAEEVVDDEVTEDAFIEVSSTVEAPAAESVESAAHEVTSDSDSGSAIDTPAVSVIDQIRGGTPETPAAEPTPSADLEPEKPAKPSLPVTVYGTPIDEIDDVLQPPRPAIPAAVEAPSPTPKPEVTAPAAVEGSAESEPATSSGSRQDFRPTAEVSTESPAEKSTEVRNTPVSEQAANPTAAEKPAAKKPQPASPVTPVQAGPAVEAPKQPVAPIVSTPPVQKEVKPAAKPGEVLFRDLPLLEEVQKAVEDSGYTTPTEIQAQIIPYMLDGRDVLAQSQTGTGKTAAFALPILSRIDVNVRRPQVLVLTPTRELAIQVGKSFETYGANLPGFSAVTIYGGSSYDPQLRQLRRGVQVVVGTPGRTIDHIKRGSLDLNGITCLALDEADEMLNMGFLEDVEYVLEKTPTTRQIALFSATMPAPIRNIAQRYLNDPARVTVKTKTMTADSIRQRAIFVQPRDKVDVLTRILEIEEADGVIVFAKTREGTVSIAETLSQQGLSAVALNGDMPQKLRERTIDQLKSGKLDILVATDVAARGLDVQRISHVFNYDVPNDSESYVHRIGRTGRAGRKGEAIIFLSNSQRYKLRSIERVTRQQIEVVQPPTADDMNATRVKQFKQKISDVMADQDLSLFHRLITEHAEESGKPMEYIAAALAHIGQDGRPFFVEDRPRRKPFDRDNQNDRRPQRGDSGGYRDRGGERGGDYGARRGGERPRQLSAPRPGMERYRIEVGSKDGVKPGNIVGAVANEGGIDGDQIGPISIHQTHSTVDLPTGMPSDIYQTLQQTWVAGKQLQLTRDTGERQEGSSPRAGGFRGGRGGNGTGGKKPFSKRKGPGNSKFRKGKPKRPRD